MSNSNNSSSNLPKDDVNENEPEINRVAYEIHLRKKVHHLRRSIRIIEHLTNNPIDEPTLIKAILFLDKNQYDDVIHERAAVKNCGFPLCSNLLTNIPKQHYKICMRTNQVIDLTERKDFCSSKCFYRSRIIIENVSESAVYTRTQEDIQNIFDKLHKVITSILITPTKEVIAQAKKEKHDNVEEEKHPVKSDSEDSVDDSIEKVLSRHPISKAHDDDDDDPYFSDSGEEEGTFNHDPLFQDEFSYPRPKRTASKEKIHPSNSISEQLPKLTKEVNKLSDSVSEQLQVSNQECERLGDSIVMDRICDWFTPQSVKYLRSMNQNDNELEEYSLKVKAFMNGGKFKSKELSCIPLVDSVSPNTIRMKILLERIYQFLPEILSVLELSINEVYESLKKLLETFNLTSKNLSLKPKQWKQAIFCLLYCLKHREPQLSTIVNGGFFDQLMRLHFDDAGSVYTCCDSLCT